MHISLPPDLEAFVQAQLASGRYASADDIICDGLYSLADTDDEWIQWLNAAIEQGLEDVKAGRVSSGDEAYVRLMARHANRHGA